MTDLSNIDWFDLYRELKRRGFAVIAFSPDELPARRWEPGSSPRQHVEHPFQCRRVDVAINSNPAPALQLDLDQPHFLAPPATRRVIGCGRLVFQNRRWQ